MRPFQRGKEFIILLAVSFALITAASRLMPPLRKEALPPGTVFDFISALFMSLAVFAALSAARSGVKTRFSRLRSETCLLAREALDAARWLNGKSMPRGTLPFVLSITALGAAVRAYFISQPMRYDEAYTFMYFIREPGNLFFYRSPNNHVFHTLLAGISAALFGGSPASIRLPAFISGVLAVPAVFYMSRMIGGSRNSGFLAASAAAVFPYMVLFSTNARGYSLVVIFSILLFSLALRFLERPSKQAVFLMSLVFALGMLTMPSFLFPAAGILLWLAAVSSWRKIFLQNIKTCFLPGVISASVLVLLLYLPVIVQSSGIYNITGNVYVRSMPFRGFIEALPAHLEKTLIHFSRDIPLFFMISGAFLIAFGSASYIRKRRFGKAVFLPLILSGGAAILLAARAVPFPRTWIYLIPFFLAAADAGFSFLPGVTQKTAEIIFGFLALVSAFILIVRSPVTGYPDTGNFPEAPVIAGIIYSHAGEEDSVVAGTPADAPVNYYLSRLGYELRDHRVIKFNPERIFFIVKPSVYSISDMTGKETEIIRKFEDAELHLRIRE